jgi:hypothetical protein
MKNKMPREIQSELDSPTNCPYVGRPGCDGLGIKSPPSFQIEAAEVFAYTNSFTETCDNSPFQPPIYDQSTFSSTTELFQIWALMIARFQVSGTIQPSYSSPS